MTVIDPLYTYTALAFVVGVVVGIGLCRAQLHYASKSLAEARELLQKAIDRNERATAFYQDTMQECERIHAYVKHLTRS